MSRRTPDPDVIAFLATLGVIVVIAFLVAFR